MHGWQREMWFDETALPWVPTSPAMPHLSTATLYPGMCLLEGTNLSLGRGTALPFEVCGAPWLDGHALAESIERTPNYQASAIRATIFTPSASNHAGSECHGVQVHVTDRDALRPVEMALQLIAVGAVFVGRMPGRGIRISIGWQVAGLAVRIGIAEQAWPRSLPRGKNRSPLLSAKEKNT